MMSFTSVSPAPINLTSKLEMEIKNETEEDAHTAIKRHTIDAILGLPRLAGYHADMMNRASFSESEVDLAEKDKSGLEGEEGE